jgi:beta-lactamase class A
MNSAIQSAPRRSEHLLKLAASSVVCVLLFAGAGPVQAGAQAPAQAQAPRIDPRLATLRAGIERTTKSVNATWGIYVKSLESGEEIAIDADRQMDTMSVIKIPLMVEVFEQIKAGKFSLSDKYTLTAEDMRPGTGVLRSLDAGDLVSIKDLLTLMIIVSDNTATDVLYRKVGGVEAVNRRMQSLGLTATRAPGPASDWFAALRRAPSPDVFHREAKTPFGLSTPREIGKLLEMAARKTLVDASSSELMLQMLGGQLYRTRIPRYITGYRVLHKTGDFLPYIGNDVGLLLADGRTIVISIFTANHFGDRDRLEEAIGDISRQVADYFTFTSQH